MARYLFTKKQVSLCLLEVVAILYVEYHLITRVTLNRFRVNSAKHEIIIIFKRHSFKARHKDKLMIWRCQVKEN